MKRILSLFLLVFSVFYIKAAQPCTHQDIKKIETVDIANHAYYWANQIPELSSEEYSLLANLLYFDCLTKHYENLSRSMLNTIYIQLIHINMQLIQSETDSKKIAANSFAKLQKLYDELLPLRFYCNTSLKACIEEIEKSPYKMLKEIMLNLKKYSQAMIEQCIKQDQESIKKLINHEKDTLEEHIATLNSYKNIYEDVLAENSPHLKEGTSSNLKNIDISIETADKILTHMNDITVATLGIKSISCDILNVQSLITRIFCNALIDLVAKKGSAPIQIMFDENGFITEENRFENIVTLDTKFSINKKHYIAQHKCI